eukprot:Blabericola_migrator_1__1327@NODE_1345_length_4757_cov_239_576333_g902_i0_p1_GENE_NODE_1345_length_4757_cov_239_576333_g902_i0NODE_1345_length_4757_cov_239_576333_g902_i0_p1_ORF_typecomplete_len600_score84_58zfC5HC2/PF02928_16/9_9zfC5HC2/PF02928_16/33_NODE_1345_length_4757_cov_239_576333_g902_i05252324
MLPRETLASYMGRPKGHESWYRRFLEEFQDVLADLVNLQDGGDFLKKPNENGSSSEETVSDKPLEKTSSADRASEAPIVELINTGASGVKGAPGEDINEMTDHPAEMQAEQSTDHTDGHVTERPPAVIQSAGPEKSGELEDSIESPVEPMVQSLAQPSEESLELQGEHSNYESPSPGRASVAKPKPPEKPNEIVYNERMRFLDMMALLATLPAPECHICYETLYLNCVACPHACFQTTEECMAAAAAAKEQLKRNTLSTPGRPKAKRRRVTKKKTEELESTEEITHTASVDVPKLAVLPCETGPDAVSLSSAVSSDNNVSATKSPPPTEPLKEAPVDEKSETAPPMSRDGSRITRRRVNSRNAARRSPDLANVNKTPASPLPGLGMMVCLNCRSKFSCATAEQKGLSVCRGILMLCRFSLSQLSLLLVLLSDKLQDGREHPLRFLEAGMPLHRQVSLIQQASSSLIRHIHRLPRLNELTDLVKTTMLRLGKWDYVIMTLNARQYKPLTELEPSLSSGSGSEEAVSAPASNEESDDTVKEERYANRSVMDQLSVAGVEVLSKLSWAYFCNSSLAVLRRIHRDSSFVNDPANTVNKKRRMM